MTPAKLCRFWDQAQEIDPTLTVSGRDMSELRKRQLQPCPFSRDLLFTSMVNGEPVLFENLCVPVRREQRLGVRDAVLRALKQGFPGNDKFQVRCGRSSTPKSMIVTELLRLWTNGRAMVNVTDLHIRGTEVIRNIDCSRLSDFNILAEAQGDVGREEMLTLVVSSAGAFTDSHTDDPDGSNHCFIGKKLWLVWDTFLGLSRGLKDVSRCTVRMRRAAFDMSVFLSIPGSRWFLVEPRQTLFLPGHLTHKVITLEPYLGIGSFFVMLPNYLRTLIRWTEHTPLWALNLPASRRMDLVNEITRRVIHKIAALESATAQQRSRWGLAYLLGSFKNWRRTYSYKERYALLDNPVSVEFLKRLSQANAF